MVLNLSQFNRTVQAPPVGVRTRVCASVSRKASPSFKSSVRRTSHIKSVDESVADLSGEWPVNWSLASYEDVGEYFHQHLFKDSARPDTKLKEMMSLNLTVATPETTIEEAKKLLAKVTGVPVVRSNADWTLVGVLSKKDLDSVGEHVKDIMTQPPVAAKPDARVQDAACLMLKYKIHRIPIVNNSAKVIGIVTRTDIFRAMENV